MEFYEVFVNFLGILKQSIKLFLKNWKSMAFVAILSQFLSSITVLLFSYIYKSLNSAMKDALMAPYRTPTTATSFDSSQSIPLIMLKNFGPFFVVGFALFVIVIISNFSSVATILISVSSSGEKTLSLQDLISIIRKSCTRKLVTGFRIRDKRMPYWILVGLLGAIIWLMHPNLIILWIAIFFGVIALIFQLYRSVDVILALVVTVVEDSYQGKDALEKSEQLIEGQKIQGFLLIMLLNLLGIVSLLVGYWMIFGDKWMLNFTVYGFLEVYGLFVVNIVSLVKMFGLVAYTVLYCEGKIRSAVEKRLKFLEPWSTPNCLMIFPEEDGCF